ncbi:hypothetical protein Cfor_04736 [Coptotermes formosanus]|jgi:hypothetical protein|uniref:Uncharacterized protein n=1 Tax=Coptotermes formosanus TaxID=36987 RepID=A0A6L2PRT7_COPFO|nr:hypothetical protein Cfor_04736 [Coptotermes formosanus]
MFTFKPALNKEVNLIFAAGYGQHFLEALDDDSFGSDLGSPSNQQKLGRPLSAAPNVGKKHSYSAAPLPTSKYSLGQPAAGKSSYVTPKHKKVPSQYQVVPYQGLYTETLPRPQPAEIVLPAYSPQAAATPTFGTRKVTAKLVQQAPVIRQGSEKLKYYTEQYREDEGFGFGAGSIY